MNLHPGDFIKRNTAYFCVAAAPLILFAPFLLGRAVFYWGTTFFQHIPWRNFAVDMIRTGQLPLWNPYLGNGTPFAANYQSAIFYPPNWLSLIFPLAFAYSWLVAGHLIWAGAGMVTLARSLGLKPFGQVFAGLAFGMSQFLVAKAGDSARESVLAWVPWVIWAADQVLLSEKRTNKSLLYFSIFCTLQLLAGHAQTTWYTYLLLCAWTLYRIITRQIDLWRPMFLMLALMLSTGLAAIQLIPTAEFLQYSQRANEFGYQGAMYYSFDPARLLTLFSPDLFGNPARGWFFGYGLFYEDAIYIGLLPFLLVLGFLFTRIKFSPRSLFRYATASPAFPNSVVTFLVVTMAVALMLGLGENTPIFPFFYRYVPTFNMFQGPARMMVWFTFSMALLAGLAADAWTPPDARNRSRLWRCLKGSVIPVILSVISYFFIPARGEFSTQIHTMSGAIAVSGCLLMLSIGFILTQPAPESPRRGLWVLLVVGFVMLDVICANVGLNPAAPPDLYEKTTHTLTGMDEHRVYEDHLDSGYYMNFQQYGSSDLAVRGRELYLANTNMDSRVPSFASYDPLKEYRFARLQNALNEKRRATILQLADVETIVSGPKSAFHSPESAQRKPSRVWVLFSAQVVEDGDAALNALLSRRFDPAKTVILEKTDAGASATHSIPFEAAQFTQSPAIVEAAASRVKIAVSMSQDGWVVLSDTYYPGWYVFVDGQPASLLHADYAFRGVAVLAGNHVIEFRYEPFSFTLGLWCTLASMGVLVGLFVVFNPQIALRLRFRKVRSTSAQGQV